MVDYESGSFLKNRLVVGESDGAVKAAAFHRAEAVFSSYQRHCVAESPGARTDCFSVADGIV